MRIQKLMKLHRLLDKAGEHGSDGGGTGTGDAGSGSGEGGAGTGEGQGTGDAGGKSGAGDAGGKSGAGEGQGAGSGQGTGAGEGGNKPSDSEAKLLKDVMKHKGRATELEAQLTQVNEKLKAFEGIDAGKVRELLAQQEEIERKKLEAKGDYDRLVKQMGETHGKEKAALLQQIEEAKGSTANLQKQIADMTVGSAFTTSKFVGEDLTLTPSKARVIYGTHFEFKDGKVVGYDKPAGASDRTMLVDSTGEPLGFEDSLRKIVEADPDKDQLIRSKMKPGAGSSTNSKVSKKVDAETKTLSSVERIAAGLKNLAQAK